MSLYGCRVTGKRGFDPITLAKEMEKHVARGLERKYVRFRATKFYGGIATGDVVGCNLRCVFCWAQEIRENPRLGFWVSAEEAFRRLYSIARRRGFSKIRLSAGEPTIGLDHLFKLLDYVDSESSLLFILETNGILIGADRSIAAKLSRYTRLHVRVSIKACNEEWFHRLTLAKPEAFQYQLMAIRNLLDYGVSFHPAVVISFGDEECWQNFFKMLSEIEPRLLEALELEYIRLYPKVIASLRRHGIWPVRAYTY
ncbi:MAG: radical SAM protein [Pyrodictiaceae archaeon]